MYFARRLLAVGLLWVCSPWVWVLFAVGLGFAWWRPWVAFFFFLVLNVDGGLWVAGGCGVKCVLQHICLDEHLKSCSTINLAS